MQLIYYVTVPVIFYLASSISAQQYGVDYAGMDYNITHWNSSSTLSPNHWEAAAILCENYCLNDPNCCSWTYCTPEAGPSDPERCCLKYGIPPLVSAATHWTGLGKNGNSSSCQNPSPPYPGPDYAVPKYTNSPGCLHIDGWHDIAGAIYVNDTYHVFQGCPGSNGWHHAISTDLVHWTNLGIDMVTLPEPYGSSSPCSGFVTVDDDGIVCAGFRECSGNWPNRSNYQVPLELRCALNSNLTLWSEPEYIFWFYFNRALPYDPVRPWKGTDGNWYATIAADGCNSTGTPCNAGGREVLFTSPYLRGPKANWTQVSLPLWTSNYTVLTPITGAYLDRELVTVDYIGNLMNDPHMGNTRVLTNNVCGNGCCGCTTEWYLGSQPNGEGTPFVVNYQATNATGMIDWGAFAPTGTGKGIAGLASTSGQYMMARTLSALPNQVNGAGRKIMIAWIGGGTAASQSLPRDLTLDKNGQGLLQQFVPELQILRISNRHQNLVINREKKETNSKPWLRITDVQSQQVEITVLFTLTNNNYPDVFGINVLLSEDGQDYVPIGIGMGVQQVYVKDRAGPLYNYMSSETRDTIIPNDNQYIWLHAYLDHQIITVIVNNQTALTVYSIPRDANSNLIELFGVDGINVLADMNVWELENI